MNLNKLTTRQLNALKTVVLGPCGGLIACNTAAGLEKLGLVSRQFTHHKVKWSKKVSGTMMYCLPTVKGHNLRKKFLKTVANPCLYF